MTWHGIANGPDKTVDQKRHEREGQDLPEDNQRDFARTLGAETGIEVGALSDLWRSGLIDLQTNERGQGEMCMTPEQAEIWSRARRAV